MAAKIKFPKKLYVQVGRNKSANGLVDQYPVAESWPEDCAETCLGNDPPFQPGERVGVYVLKNIVRISHGPLVIETLE